MGRFGIKLGSDTGRDGTPPMITMYMQVIFLVDRMPVVVGPWNEIWVAVVLHDSCRLLLGSFPEIYLRWKRSTSKPDTKITSRYIVEIGMCEEGCVWSSSKLDLNHDMPMHHLFAADKGRTLLDKARVNSVLVQVLADRHSPARDSTGGGAAQRSCQCPRGTSGTEISGQPFWIQGPQG